jgi:hypothetical protein
VESEKLVTINAMSAADGFVPPPYPYERLDEIIALAGKHEGGAVDLSIGTPCDPPPPGVLDALAVGDTARGYPPSIGTSAYRSAVAEWLTRRFGVTLDPQREIAAVVGSKEFVASTPQYLRLRDPLSDLRDGCDARRLPRRRVPRPRRHRRGRRGPRVVRVGELARQPDR